MKKNALFLSALLTCLAGYSQFNHLDSTLHAKIHADSVKIEKEFADKMKSAKLLSAYSYPVINAGENSGVTPITDADELPDPAIDYKLLFDLKASNPDSLIKELNEGLTEVARVINLHAASGVPVKKIFPVVSIRGPAVYAISSNDFYKEHYKTDNPNIQLINELKALGTKFIVCGQSLASRDIKKEVLLPVVKISLTAQTVITSYQSKGYVLIKVP